MSPAPLSVELVAIPQEILASMQHERKLEDPQFTHFVGEVVEGANATLSIVRSCSSSDYARTIPGALKAGILRLPLGIGGQTGLMTPIIALPTLRM
jgi:hypothetical protein